MLLESNPFGHPPAESFQPDYQRRSIRPVAVYALHGLASTGTDLLALDSIRGYVVKVHPQNDDTAVLNSRHVEAFLDASGLALWEQQVWFGRENEVYWCDLNDFTPQLFVELPYSVDGVAVWQSTLYVSSQKLGYVLVFDRKSGRQITRFPLPGVGRERLTVRGEELWICDDLERTVYCMDRGTGEVLFSLITPYDLPTGLAFHPNPDGGADILYVAYAEEEFYIRDNPNDEENPRELTTRDRTFIHPLHIYYNPEKRYTLSNGYLIEMSYVEEISPLDEVPLTQLEWRIALPATTDRQKVLRVEPVGMPFTEEEQVALLKFSR